MSPKPTIIRQLDLAQLQLLYDLAEAVSRADDPNEIYRAAVEGLAGGIADRASVMVFDADGVMRFKASKGISARHRSVMEGKMTWRRGDRNATALTIPDVTEEPSVSAFLPTLELEGIRAIALIPLMGNGGLIGKFVLYYDEPREFHADELRLIRTIATHVAFAAERQLAAAALRESEERYREVFNNAAEGFFLIDVTSDERFKFVEFNPVIESLTGLSNSDVSGLFVEDVLPEPRAGTVIANYRRCVEAGTGIAYEEELRLPVGRRHFSVHLNPVRNRDGRVYRIIGVARDITERLRADAELRQSEERFRVAVESHVDAIVMVNQERKIILLNARAEEMFGYRREELVGQPLRLLVPVSYLESDLSARNHYPPKLQTRSTSKARNLQARRKDGTEFPVEIDLSPIQTAQGTGWLTSIIDITERNRSENALRETLQQLQLITDNMEAAVTRCSSDLRYLWVNKSYAAWLGRVPEDIAGRPILDVIGQEAFETMLPHIEKVLSGQREEYDAQVNYLGSGQRWIHAVYVPTKGQNHKVDGWIAVVMDVTKRHQAEEALRSTEQQLRMAQNAAHLAGWSRNLATNEVTTFGEYAELYGLGADQTPRTLEEFVNLIHPEDRDRVQANLKDARDRGDDFEIEFRIPWRDGSTHWICGKGAVHYDDSGRVVSTAGVNFDITERKNAEAALRESEERFRRVFEEGPLGLALVGTDYRFLKVNSTLCQMVGYLEAELIQKSFIDITHPDDLQTDMQLSQQLFRGDIPLFRMQKRYLRKSGEILWINLTASVVRDRDGKPRYGLAMMEDITEVKRNQEESLSRQKLESVGTLASGIAHDFNNLLGSVMSLAELAAAECDSGSDPTKELEAIRNVAMRGSEIVGQLMIYAGKESESFEQLDVSLVVKEMIELIKVSISKQARLETHLDEDLPAVRGSAAQIRQIVLNLITNASEAIGDRDGVIRVTTSCIKVGPSAGGAISDRLAEGDYLKLVVADTGRGMSQETQARIFDPFFTTKSAGHGLGLAVVHGIVRGLRGAIHVVSDLGKGTSFQILLPCYATKSAAIGVASADVAEPTRFLQDKTILVVEDEDPLRQAVAKMLHKAGLRVLEASNGSAAIELLREKSSHIDVLLLDLTIPGRSSNEVVAEALRTRQDIRIVLTSAYGREMAASAVSEAKNYVFIRKPFQLRDLIKVISSGAERGTASSG